MPLSNFDARMTAYGTSLASRDVRLDSAKRAKADIEQVAVADARDGSVVASRHRVVSSLHCRMTPSGGSHGKPHRTPKILSHARRRGGRLAACGNFGVAKTPVSHREESTHMKRKSFLVGLLAAGCFVATSTLMTSPGNAQADPKVAKAMEILKAETAKLGAPKAEGTDQTADKTTPGLYFGSTKVNNDFTVVDKVKAEAGGTATLFVKSGDDYVRVSTNVPGSVHGRALGTILDPRGKAIVNINKGEAFYGEVDILGKPYVTGYDQIKDASGKVIGIWYVGYEK